ncbi:MAG: hypothetical protein H7210_12885 [Pyrinomonadaceae bacterium]|nr:hypothetical protein [Phycisphaerales bacterium]
MQAAHDFRRLAAYVIRYQRESTNVESSPAAPGMLSRVLGWRSGNDNGSRRQIVTMTASLHHVAPQRPEFAAPALRTTDTFSES